MTGDVKQKIFLLLETRFCYTAMNALAIHEPPSCFVKSNI